MSSAREAIVVLFSLVVGLWLLVATWRRQEAASGRDVLDRVARLTLGVSIILIALFLLAGQPRWAVPTANGNSGSGSTIVAPAWVNVVGVLVLLAFTVSGLVVLGGLLARRRRRQRFAR